ncbi:MAG: c-type cytochrome [Acidobacteriota bacterium]
MGFRWWRQSALVLATVGVLAGLPAVVVQALRPAIGAAAQQPPARQSVWDGVYTDDQAARGETHYARSCEACHGADLSGNPVDEIPALAWDAFLLHWNEKTIRDLYDSIKRSMPQDKPGSLNARAYADVVAYLLQVNKFPSGAKEIGLNPDVLGQIVIERKK